MILIKRCSLTRVKPTALYKHTLSIPPPPPSLPPLPLHPAIPARSWSAVYPLPTCPLVTTPVGRSLMSRCGVDGDGH